MNYFLFTTGNLAISCIYTKLALKRDSVTIFVELEGVEPSSKHVAKILSTRLSFVCLSAFVR